MNKEIVLDALNEAKRLQKINAELLAALEKIIDQVSILSNENTLIITPVTLTEESLEEACEVIRKAKLNN